MNASIPRKPVPTIAAAHLEGPGNVSSRSSTIRLVTTEDGQDAPSNLQTKEIEIGLESGNTTSSSQLYNPGDEPGESKFYGIPHRQDATSNLQTKEMEAGTANGDTASSIGVGGDEPGERERCGGGALGCLGVIKAGTFASTLSRHFNNCLPPQRTYLNGRINRRTLLITIGVTFISLLALIISLAVGLTTGSQNKIPTKPDGTSEMTGDFTYYSTGLGACGITNTDNDAIVAISHERFDQNMVDQNPNHNKLCGRKIRAYRTDERTGKEASIELTITDRCAGCSYDDIDVSPIFFDKLAAQALGRVKVQWYFL